MLKKKYDFKETEARVQKFWTENEVYKYNPEASGQVYSIDTPPPTVSGKIHIGHIFSYTQAEMIARYNRMNGYNVFYPFGFDDNGLPTERLVERDLNIIAKNLPRETFIDHCIKSTKIYENDFKSLWQQMGFSCDWGLEYRTIDESSQRISQRSFLELAKKGKAYIDESPVLWCTHCQTSIAQAELDSVEKHTLFSTIEFKTDSKTLLIATTRPELLYGCVAIFVHPEDDRYKALVGSLCKVPLYDFEVPILTDEHVQMDKGTGLVMCCTFGDSTDLDWYKTYKFDYKKIIEKDGHINKNVPLIGGMYVSKARKEILSKLKEENLLIEEKAIEHTVSVHERCGTSVEIIPSKQWYIDILTRKEDYLKAAEEINWYPSYMKKRYIAWVENLKWNWCVSRQRYYGVPIPVWYCSHCQETYFPEDSELPINPMTDMPKGKCSCGSNEFRPETAVLDTWATSSITPEINNKWGEADERNLGPMTLRTQAHEIIRTWAFYTIVKSLEHHERLPWKDIMICGFVLAKKGEKISKSKNNAAESPIQLIETHSSDAIRYWTANAKLGTDTMFEEDELKLSKRFLTKLWNASKFTIMQLEDFKAADLSKVLETDQWIISKYHQTVKKAQYYLDQYEVGLARHVIDEFFWKEFCDNYLEFAKDRLYKTDLYEASHVESGRQAIYYTMLGILKLYSIYVPHMTEEIYKEFFETFEGCDSIHLMQWDKVIEDDESLHLGSDIKQILSEVRKYKADKGWSIKEPIESLIVQSKHAASLKLCIADLRGCTHASIIEINQGDTFDVTIKS